MKVVDPVSDLAFGYVNNNLKMSHHNLYAKHAQLNRASCHHVEANRKPCPVVSHMDLVQSDRAASKWD